MELAELLQMREETIGWFGRLQRRWRRNAKTQRRAPRRQGFDREAPESRGTEESAGSKGV